MTKRVKPLQTVPVLKSLDDANDTIAQIAALQRHVALINLGLNEDIDALKKKAAADCEPLNADIDVLETSLARYAEYNKEELFAKKKSHDLPFGTFGFRQSTRLVTLGKTTFKRVLEMLQDRDLAQYIRTKAEPDKEKLKGAGPELLKTLGCKLSVTDEFFYEVAEQESVAMPSSQAADNNNAA